MRHRNEIGFLLNELNLLGEGAEIGVQEGKYSREILSRWSGKMLNMIDCWEQQDQYVDLANLDDDAQTKFMQTALENVAPFDGRFNLIKDYSIKASKRFKARSLDFIYLDARHDYKGVTEDLKLWYPKVRKGGLIAGHDYLEKDGVYEVESYTNKFKTAPTEFFVRGAVKNFIKEKKIHQIVSETSQDAPFLTFFFIKP